MDIGGEILAFFEGIGAIGLVVAFALISFLDGFAIPTLPEAFLMFIALSNVGVSAPVWGVILVTVGVISAVSAQALLYSIVKKIGMPRRVDRLMNKWAKFLVVSNEKLAFVNWLAPVIPFTGAFIAVCRWKPRLAFIYSVLGGIVKMSIIVSIALLFPLLVDRGTVASASIILILVVLGVSLAVTFIRHKMIEKKMQGMDLAKKE